MAGSMKRRMLAVGAALALTVTACSGTGDSDQAGGASGKPEDTGPVKLLLFGDPHELKAYNDLISAYGAKHSGRKVEIIEASDRADLIARLSTSIAGGSPPDVFLLNYRYYAQFAAKNALAPVGDRLQASTVIKESDYYPTVLDAFRWRGKLACMPQNVSSLVVYYNRALFKKYGVAEPPAQWTFDQLVATAKQLTRDKAGKQVAGVGGADVASYGLGAESSLVRLAPFVWSNGGQLVDDPKKPTKMTLDSPEATAVMDKFFALRQTHGVVPTEEEMKAEEDADRFANGRLGMLLSSRRDTTTFRNTKGLDFDVAPLPQFGAQTVGILHSDAYCMTAQSKHQDAAWKFIEFAMSPDGQKILAKTGRTVPSNIEVSKSAAFLDPSQAPKRAQVFLDAIPNVRPLPVISNWPEIEDVANGMLEDGMFKGVPATEVGSKLGAATGPILGRAEGP
jgi:multiple sugar transport system substrate-binding protein